MFSGQTVPDNVFREEELIQIGFRTVLMKYMSTVSIYE